MATDFERLERFDRFGGLTGGIGISRSIGGNFGGLLSGSSICGQKQLITKLKMFKGVASWCRVKKFEGLASKFSQFLTI